MTRSMQRRAFMIMLILGLLLVLPVPLTTRASDPGSETLTTLLTNDIPPRDQFQLARQILGITTIPATPATPKIYEIGDQESFTAVDNEQNTDFTITAQLWYKTAHVYMWFQTGFQPDLDAIKRSAETFENKIYPTVHEYFGIEASPGIDNDVHLYILNARGLGGSIAGYFDSRGQFPAVVVPGSNEHQMFFMNLDSIANMLGTDYYDSVLAHEFQHMVQSNIDQNEQGWVDEGLAELSAALCGYNDLKFMPMLMSHPEVQLNAWSDGSNAAVHYGASYAFMSYFLQRFGETGIKRLVADQGNGLEGVRSALKSLNEIDPQSSKPITAEDFFSDWVMTNLVDDKHVGDGRFEYTAFNAQPDKPVTTPAVVGSQQDLQTGQWGTTYIKVDKPGTYRLTFKGQPTVKVVPADAHSGRKMWWSTSFDRSDTRLTRAFDLSTVDKATLSFWLWFGIEKDWDYGYVMVSTDDGVTWKSLASEDSQPAGGHNNPYGPGYSGFSGSTDASGAVWRKQTVDLSAYAGKKILVRFEYITDDAQTQSGMLIDDIAVPEINYSSDAETDDGGWKGEGWVRIENVLPQRFIVQMAEYGTSPRVFHLLNATENPDGAWDVKVGGDVSQLVIAVSGITEFTREPADFSYTLTQ